MILVLVEKGVSKYGDNVIGKILERMEIRSKNELQRNEKKNSAYINISKNLVKNSIKIYIIIGNRM